MASTINADNGVLSGSAGLKSSADSTGVLALQTNGTTAVTVDTSQNVGIGTTSPLSKLDALNGTAGKSAFSARGISGNLYIDYNGAGNNYYEANYHLFTNNNGATEWMRIDSSGNVGIGQSSITQAFSNYTQLNISGSSGATIQMQSGSTNRANIVADGNGLYLAGLSGYMVFSTGGTGTGTERARIDSSGNLLVGTTSIPSTGAGTNSTIVSNKDYSGAFAQIINSSSTSGTQFFVQFGRGSSECGKITSTGTNSTTYTTSSDYRLKHDIQPMQGALAKVAALKPCTYKWNADNSNGEGFIAHELAEVVPQAVVGEKDAVYEDGSINPQGIDTSFLVATLTAAIQEQQAIITDLQTRLAALEAK